MIEGIVSGTAQVDDHNWSRKKLRFCVQKVGDVNALYYLEKETGDSKRPPLRVVAIEDLWGTLVDVHGEVGDGGRQRMDEVRSVRRLKGGRARGQEDLLDLQLFEDNDYKFIILRPLKTMTAVEVADCLMGIFFEHGPPSLLLTDNGAEFSNKTPMAGLRSSGQASASCTAGHAILRTREVLS